MIHNMLIKQVEVECSACGKKVPMNCMFISLMIGDGASSDQPPTQFPVGGMVRSMGVYGPGEYHICYECAFKALGIEGNRRESE